MSDYKSNKALARLRLFSLREQAEAKGGQMARVRGRFQALQDAEKPAIVRGTNLYPTPAHIADIMADMLGVTDAGTILEPSAGTGNLYRAIRDKGLTNPMILVEQSGDCCKVLYEKTAADTQAKLKQGDFLALPLPPELDKVKYVIMNPPFERGDDIRHILRALDWLESGGVLVGLCYAGIKQELALKYRADYWERLPSGTFKESGTRAEVILFRIKT